jgi:hypothetical protein
VKNTSKPLVQPPQVTLATWIRTLGPGSPCFCCGSPLRTAPLEKTRNSTNPPRLVCPECGAEVFGDTALPAWAATGERRSALAAA